MGACAGLRPLAVAAAAAAAAAAAVAVRCCAGRATQRPLRAHHTHLPKAEALVPAEELALHLLDGHLRGAPGARSRGARGDGRAAAAHKYLARAPGRLPPQRRGPQPQVPSEWQQARHARYACSREQRGAGSEACWHAHAAPYPAAPARKAAHSPTTGPVCVSVWLPAAAAAPQNIRLFGCGGATCCRRRRLALRSLRLLWVSRWIYCVLCRASAARGEDGCARGRGEAASGDLARVCEQVKTEYESLVNFKLLRHEWRPNQLTYTMLGIPVSRTVPPRHLQRLHVDAKYREDKVGWCASATQPAAFRLATDSEGSAAGE